MASKKPASRAAGGITEDSETNVQVIVRCRPPSQDEIAQRTPQVIKCDEANREVTLSQNTNGKQFGRTYHFDKVFSPDTSQERLYNTAISPIVEEVLQGFNCTIFAYGQTGTGKTHTMTGDLSSGTHVPDSAGVIPRAMKQIFDYLDSIGTSSEFTVKCCFLELYNEEVTDLLAIGTEAPKVRIMEDRSGVVVHGLEEPHVKDASEIFSLLETGNARRRTAETLLNKQSSRSHSVFIVTVSVREVLAEGEEVIRVGKLYLIDLAGSENVSRSGAVDQRAKEAGNINKSLLTLGRVITALVEGQGHVPYRDSKLTRLLRDSLGGRTKTCIIATIAPTVQCQEETLSTLDYAHRAKNIKNKPEVNQRISKTTHLKELSVEIARLKAELVAAREKNGVYLPVSQYEEECEERRALGVRVEELEEETFTSTARHEEEKAALCLEWQSKVDRVEGELDQCKALLEATRAELAAAKESIAERDFMLEKYRQCEASLAEHADSLTIGLAGAAADVVSLFARVDAKNAIEDKNLAVVAGMKDQTAKKLSALEAAVKATSALQSERFIAARSVLVEAAQRKAAAATALEEHVDALQTKMASARAAATSAVESVAAACSSSLNTINEQHVVAFMKAAETAAAEASVELKNACTAISTSAAEEKASLDALLHGQEEASMAVQDAAQTIVSTITQQLGDARSQAEAARSAMEASIYRQVASAESLQTEFTAAARQDQSALVEQLSAMIAGFVEKAEGRVISAVSTMKKQAKADQKSLQTHCIGMIDHADASLAGLDTTSAHLAAVQENAAASLQDNAARLRAAVENSAACGASLGDTANASAVDACNALSEHSKSLAASLKKGGKAMETIAANESKKCVGIADEAAAACCDMHAAIVGDLSADDATITQLKENIAAGGNALQSFAKAHKAGLAGLGEDIVRAVDHDYTVDIDRNAVPTTRERCVPGREHIQSLMAPSARDLAREFRARSSSSASLLKGSHHGGNAGGDESNADFVENTSVGDEDHAAATAERDMPRSSEVDVDAKEENDNEENIVPVASMPALNDSTPLKSNANNNKAAGAGQKRHRSPTEAVNESPSKLRAAFHRGERRRATRHTVAE